MYWELVKRQDPYQYDFVRAVRLDILFAEQELRKSKYLYSLWSIVRNEEGEKQ